jgi:hypothetical protein
MRTLSANAFRELFAQESGDTFLTCLTLSHASFSSPIMVVYNNQPVVRTAGTFTPCLFQINLPEEVEGQVPEIHLTIDNVDRAITDAIRTITGSRVKVTLEVVLGSNPNDIQFGPADFFLMSADYNADTVSGALSLDDDVLNSTFPATQYTPSSSPGLFK